ncbi:MAG: hypothetical protein JW881_16765 [Spirochaetales bacterium]|nr:hypothetical protein [Spirochaetales bacterium]
MINETELEKIYRSNIDDYGTMLLDYYIQQTKNENTVKGLLTKAFLENHVVTGGSLNAENAKKIAKRRSNQFTKSFTSTLISLKMALHICRYFMGKGNGQFLKDHIRKKKFDNYKVDIKGQTIMVKIDKNKKEALLRQGNGIILIGINERGFINHLEGHQFNQFIKEK